jgi:hypothetical protein
MVEEGDLGLSGVNMIECIIIGPLSLKGHRVRPNTVQGQGWVETAGRVQG